MKYKCFMLYLKEPPKGERNSSDYHGPVHRIGTDPDKIIDEFARQHGRMIKEITKDYTVVPVTITYKKPARKKKGAK